MTTPAVCVREEMVEIQRAGVEMLTTMLPPSIRRLLLLPVLRRDESMMLPSILIFLGMTNYMKKILLMLKRSSND
jgi:hypothetical protein